MESKARPRRDAPGGFCWSRSEPTERAAAGLSSLAAVAAAEPSPRHKPWAGGQSNHKSPSRGERRVDSMCGDGRSPVGGVGWSLRATPRIMSISMLYRCHGSIAPAGAFGQFSLAPPLAPWAEIRSPLPRLQTWRGGRDHEREATISGNLAVGAGR